MLDKKPLVFEAKAARTASVRSLISDDTLRRVPVFEVSVDPYFDSPEDFNEDFCKNLFDDLMCYSYVRVTHICITLGKDLPLLWTYRDLHDLYIDVCVP